MLDNTIVTVLERIMETITDRTLTGRLKRPLLVISCKGTLPATLVPKNGLHYNSKVIGQSNNCTQENINVMQNTRTHFLPRLKAGVSVLFYL